MPNRRLTPSRALVAAALLVAPAGCAKRAPDDVRVSPEIVATAAPDTASASRPTPASATAQAPAQVTAPMAEFVPSRDAEIDPTDFLGDEQFVVVNDTSAPSVLPSLALSAVCKSAGLSPVGGNYVAATRGDWPLFSTDGHHVAVTYSAYVDDAGSPDLIFAVLKRAGETAVEVESVRVTTRDDLEKFAPATQSCATARARVEANITKANAMIAKYSWRKLARSHEPGWEAPGVTSQRLAPRPRFRLLDPKAKVRVDVSQSRFAAARSPARPNPGVGCGCSPNAESMFWDRANSTLFVRFAQICPTDGCGAEDRFGFFRLAP